MSKAALKADNRHREEAAPDGDVTLSYAASDSDHNNAVVLRDYLLTRLRRIEAKEGPSGLVHRI
jgi:uncharacterized protein YeaO (DUF488 family)